VAGLEEKGEGFGRFVQWKMRNHKTKKKKKTKRVRTGDRRPSTGEKGDVGDAVVRQAGARSYEHKAFALYRRGGQRRGSAALISRERKRKRKGHRRSAVWGERKSRGVSKKSKVWLNRPCRPRSGRGRGEKGRFC